MPRLVRVRGRRSSSPSPFSTDYTTNVLPRLVERRPTAGAPVLTGKLLIKQLHMRYRQDAPPVLRGVNLEIPAGTKVAVVGRTGAGKSSLFLALQRLYTFTGVVIVDDAINIQKDSLQNVRDIYSYVPQDPILYQGTIRNNLIQGMALEELPSERLLWSALERVSMATKVREWPDQLETKILSQGENLSAGERQLLCLARALLRRARILLVDEGMSSVDERTERVAHDTLLSLSGCTVLSICHNLGSLHRFDYVVVMDGGRVAEHGTPSLLMNGQDEQPGVILRELVSKS